VQKKSRREDLFYRSGDALRELDRKIEEGVAEVLHRSPVPWSNPPRYTLEIARAHFLLDVVERREGGRTSVVETPTGWACSLDFGGEDHELIVGRGDTEALAICAAFMSERPDWRKNARRDRGLGARFTRAVRRITERAWNLRAVARVREVTRKLLFR